LQNCGSLGSEVVPVISTLSVNGSAAIVVAAAKSSLDAAAHARAVHASDASSSAQVAAVTPCARR